jgi:hypothetical protein
LGHKGEALPGALPENSTIAKEFAIGTRAFGFFGLI